ncbi:MAG: hypothetical protein AABX30_01365 [Nanoarchaeota archaeon]
MAIKKTGNTKNYKFLDAPRIINSCGFLISHFKIKNMIKNGDKENRQFSNQPF